MSKRIIYISIPITGYDETQQRNRANAWAHYLKAMGDEVVNPFDIADRLKERIIIELNREPTYNEYLNEDIHHLCFCTDLLLCDGWVESFGCIQEVNIAMRQGIKFHFENKIKLDKLRAT